MNVVIVEDEYLTAERLENLLRKYDPSIQVITKIPSVSEAVEWFQENPKPDLAFMDIHLEDGLAFSIFDQISLTIPIIFTTAYDEYTIRAFKVNSIDYLLKPIDPAELKAALDKFKTLHVQPDLRSLLQLINKPQNVDYKDRFMVSIGTKIRSIETADIAYFFSEDKITFLVTQEGQKLPVEYSLDKLSQLTDPKRFFRLNRQFLVSFSAIHTVHTYSAGKLKVDLDPDLKQEVFVSGDRITDFKNWLGR
ncbi:MAG: LytTR family DNA-binding domain-containing protein [Siphonobacter sp.]